MLLLNNGEIESLLDMPSCLDALEVGYRDLLEGGAGYRGRIDFHMPCDYPEGYFRWGHHGGRHEQAGRVRHPDEVGHPNVARRQDGGEALHRAGHVLRAHLSGQHPQRGAPGYHERRDPAAHAGGRLCGARGQVPGAA